MMASWKVELFGKSISPFETEERAVFPWALISVCSSLSQNPSLLWPSTEVVSLGPFSTYLVSHLVPHFAAKYNSLVDWSVVPATWFCDCFNNLICSLFAGVCVCVSLCWCLKTHASCPLVLYDTPERISPHLYLRITLKDSGYRFPFYKSDIHLLSVFPLGMKSKDVSSPILLYTPNPPVQPPLSCMYKKQWT